MENRKFTGAFPNRGLGTRSLAGFGTRSLNKILQGDAMKVLKEMPEQFVNMIMCSPPYWALRDYGDNVKSIWDGEPECEHEFNTVITKQSNMSGGKGHLQDGNTGSFAVDYKDRVSISQFCTKCGAWKGQLGLEPSFELYIKHLCDIFDEAKRVLRDDGTCWVNIGDTYASSPKGNKKPSGLQSNNYGIGKDIPMKKNIDYDKIPSKSLVMIPFRFAIEMVSRGWILRNTIIWHKPNCMPSSAKDRFTVDYEYLFFFSKKKKYYFEQQFEKYELSLDRWGGIYTDGNVQGSKYFDESIDPAQLTQRARNMRPHPLGRNKRCVWSICPQPYPEAHFATYPEELCVTPISAGCPMDVCKKCGKARDKIFDISYKNDTTKDGRPAKGNDKKNRRDNNCMNFSSGVRTRKIVKENGYTDCGCGAGFEPGIVLDPFFGSGTTGLTALKLGRDFIGIEQNDEYIKLAEKRLASELEQERLAI